MKKRHAVCGAAFFLANVVASPAQTDPGLSTKPAGVTLSGERLAPEKAPVDLSRPEMRQIERLSTRLESEYADAATRGEAWAQTKLGKAYVTNIEDAQIQQQGVALLRQAAEQDDAEAIYLLATLSAAGVAVEQSNLNAFEQMKRAAELGFAEAQFELTMMYLEGRGTSVDRDAALAWARTAAAQDSNSVKYSLALALLSSEQGPEANSEAMSWLTSAANEGYSEALFFLAGAIAHGDYGLEKDEEKAAEMTLPLAKAGDPEFQFALATLYLRGESFGEHRRTEGIKWLKEAAEGGQLQAQEMLGEITEEKIIRSSE
jgi:TPR repeat protein